MRAVYLYGVVGYPPPFVRGVLGLGDSPVFLVGGPDLAAVASYSPLDVWPIDEAHVRRHEAVVEAIMRDRPVLPMRYNSLLPDKKAVTRLLRQRSRALVAALGRVGGSVEMGLRVLAPAPGAGAVLGRPLPLRGRGPGTSYLRRRMEEERRGARERKRGQQLIAELGALLEPLVAESSLRPFLTERLTLSASYLVAHDRVAAFRERVGVVQQRFSAFGFLLTGPWPPYHFANGSADG